MKNSVNEFAAQGFQVSTDAYERGRPDYPEEAVSYLTEKLNLNENKIVIDLGAGTGKFTRMLQESDARIIAIEPVEGMRKKFSSILPEVQILNGTAEQIPLPDESVDAVVVAQAFHWFQGEAALKEIYRILRPHGKLGLIWNVRDERLDWISQLTRIIDAHERGAPRYKTGEWKKAFMATKLFSALDYADFSHTQTGPVEMVVDRISSTSFIAALPHDEKESVLKQVRVLVKTHPQTRDSATIQFPYRTDVFVCEKI
jgi:SAM-dependent methyltransferase